MDSIARTPRFTIRLFKPEEEEHYLSLFDDERVTRYLPVRSRGEHIQIFRDHLREGAAGDITGRWGIFNAADDGLIGMCLLRLFDDGSDMIELGYVLHHHYWGKGIATEMACVLLSRMIAINPLARFCAVTAIDNIPSQRVLEKTGMRRDGNYTRQGEELAFFTTPPTN